MLGLPKGEVFLVPWCEEWEREFISERESILAAAGQYILDVHHIGSTAVKHLSAKPIIDIAIEINEFQDGTKCAAPLEKLGYAYKGTDVLPDRHYFNKGEPRTHQIHMYRRGSNYLLEQLAFRDYLRGNEAARMQYEQLKKQLSAAHKGDKHNYADSKTDFVKTILAITEK
ncbi:GrpB family protein [Paenibacillus sp. NPDC056579]|uniref:GrpB family protein n=1 Tax=unclassified Paenibacillus TaxID=185978 RepID=UPI001EF7A1F6|nr:GrpB family protein [Paenibacillus sp. H1-7]ULL18379.1 GrpB family protein [Paenibacillus sp. H1-7]